jgi:hypothetical protein
MVEGEKPEFVGEVYRSDHGFTGHWSVRAGNRVIEENEIHSRSEGGARHHVAYEARTRGFVWKE